MKVFFLALFLAVFLGCTEGQRAQIGAFGEQHEIKVYSGGKLIYLGTSTGKLHAEDQSDGWYFVDKKTRKLTRVSGDTIITVK
jgi:hypothetical protein